MAPAAPGGSRGKGRHVRPCATGGVGRAAAGRPIVVGPWTGEVGFELLYWVPFVRWVVNTYGMAPDRLLVVSRGGVSSWYGSLAARYADVFLYFSPEEFRVATEDAKKGVVARIVPGPHDAHRQDPHRPMRYDTGRPRAVIRFKISQPRTASLPCPAGLRARRPSPMMDL